jgi:hypothetical protein
VRRSRRCGGTVWGPSNSWTSTWMPAARSPGTIRRLVRSIGSTVSRGRVTGRRAACPSGVSGPGTRSPVEREEAEYEGCDSRAGGCGACQPTAPYRPRSRGCRRRASAPRHRRRGPRTAWRTRRRRPGTSIHSSGGPSPAASPGTSAGLVNAAPSRWRRLPREGAATAQSMLVTGGRTGCHVKNGIWDCASSDSRLGRPWSRTPTMPIWQIREAELVISELSAPVRELWSASAA